MIYSPAVENRGLDESVIRSIPVFKYKKREENSRIHSECAVCLNEFQENEKLRVIPNCAHIFHIDCIDVWLQNNANCPLCRNSISSCSTPYQDPNLENFRDEDYVVIEISNNNQERVSSRKCKKFRHVTSMGDECINMRKKDDEFDAIQPIRRSFSMDSATDRQLYVAVQEIIMQQQRQVSDVSPFESSSSRVKRSFFSFGHGRGSRNVVLPIHLES
ncbi:hypothetical protein MTR67_041367 [Solanum verrucosum]|uniref:RING-type E3 ubiquitin transferase n=1 Tax=Solanum verrucosum TaxID=315347 RepID=A0AAF0UKV5_SOLVR|nr:hypothetical protein MTR67_041367 [Solanum verrucosum]